MIDLTPVLKQVPVLLMTSLLLLASNVPSFGSPTPPDDEVLIPPSPEPIRIEIAALLDNDADFDVDLIVSRFPRWGVLTKISPSELKFVPSADFWRHGLDSFAYRGLDDRGSAVSEGRTVLLVASRFGVPAHLDSFEQGLEAWHTSDVPQGIFVVCPEGAVSDSKGLCLSRPLASEEEIQPDIFDSGQVLGNGDTQTGGGTVMCIPRCSPPGLLTLDKASLPIPKGVGSAAGMKLFTVGVEPSVEVRVRDYSDGFEVSASAEAHQTAWIPVPEEVPVEVFVSWPDDVDVATSETVALLVDGRPVDFLQVTPKTNGFSLNVAASSFLPLQLDDVEIWWQPDEPSPLVRRRMVDDFEQGLESDWRFSNGVPPVLDLSDPIAGIASLLVDAGFGGSDSGLEATWPAGERAFGLSFLADLDSLSMAPGHLLLIAGLSGESLPEILEEHVRLWIRQDEFGKSAALQTLDPLADEFTAWIPVGSGVHQFMVAWQVDRGPLDDGSAELWIDGSLAGSLEDLDNEGKKVDSYRVGAFVIPATTSGLLKLDDVTAWGKRR